MRNLTNVLSDGFLLFDSRMNPIFVNPSAAQILAYPEEPEKHELSVVHLAGKVRSMLVAQPSSNGSTLVPKFRSGRRQYVCRSFRIDALQAGVSTPLIAAILERASTPPRYANRLNEFNLTTREQEVALLLVQGLTSKEIAARLQISPNTVKAFLRVIMVKMGVSTRSGIVGKAFGKSL